LPASNLAIGLLLAKSQSKKQRQMVQSAVIGFVAAFAEESARLMEPA
jgi:hypothetical protein